jgi:hypothetical protein
LKTVFREVKIADLAFLKFKVPFLPILFTPKMACFVKEERKVTKRKEEK